jgi:hypothetical protein
MNGSVAPAYAAIDYSKDPGYGYILSEEGCI